MTRVSRIIAAALTVVVVLTAQSAALARTMPDAAGHMILCTGTGPVMVYTDADGNPTAPPHLCPEYALSLIVALDVPQMQISASGRWQTIRCAPVPRTAAAMRGPKPQARAPPVQV